MRFVAAALLLAAFYALFAGSFSVTEAWAGLIAVAVGGGFGLMHRRAADRKFSFAGVPWLRVIFRPLLALPSDSWRVGQVLLGIRPPARALAAQPFDYGNGEAAAARRALVTLGASLAPNGFVVRLDGETDVLALHRLADAPLQPDRQWPI